MPVTTLVIVKFALTGLAVIALVWALWKLQTALRNKIKSSAQARTQAIAQAIAEQLNNEKGR